MLKSLGIHKGDMGNNSANSKYLRVKMEKVTKTTPKKLKNGGSSSDPVKKSFGGLGVNMTAPFTGMQKGAASLVKGLNARKAKREAAPVASVEKPMKNGGKTKRVKKFFGGLGGQLLKGASDGMNFVGNGIRNAATTAGNAIANSPGGQQISGVVNQAKQGMGLKEGGSSRLYNPGLGVEGRGLRKLRGDAAMPGTAKVDQAPVTAKKGGRQCKAAGGVGKVRKDQYS